MGKLSIFIISLIFVFLSSCKESDPGADGNVYVRFANINNVRSYDIAGSDTIPGVPSLDSNIMLYDRKVQTKPGTYTIKYRSAAGKTVLQDITFVSQKGEESQVTNEITDGREISRGGKGRDGTYTLNFGTTKITVIYDEGLR